MSNLFVLLSRNIASALAKHIAKSWIGHDFLDQLAEELIDLVTGDTGQTTEPYHQQRDIDAVAVAASSRMQHVYQLFQLSEHAKRAVAAELALTLSQSAISVQLIVAQRMDAQKLVTHMLSVRTNATTLFSDDETALYKRLISEAAYAQIQIASLLESFPGALADRLLKDNDQLIAMIEKLLYEPGEKARKFEAEYKKTVKRKLDRLEIFGLPTLDRYGGQQALSTAYISLDAESPVPKSTYVSPEEINESFKIFEDSLNYTYARRKPVDDPPTVRSAAHLERLHSILLELWSTVGRLNAGKHFDRRSHSIETVLAKKRRIIIQGQAGSGKTTLLQWLAVRAAAHDFKDHLSSWNGTVPFFIRLREYVGRSFPTPNEFPEKVAPMIIDKIPPDWVHTILDSGRGLVLIDGVDEFPFSQRDAMLTCLSDLVATYPASRYIVSSRPAALKEQLWPQWKDWVAEEAFFTTRLRDMDSALVATFIEQWHKALAANAADAEEQAHIHSHVANLKSLLNGRPPLRRLATNPLLCAMICALYQERLQNLPTERLNLYEECVEMLLMRRDEGRRISTSYDYPELILSQRLSLIQDLAYWMIANGYPEAGVGQVDQRFERKLPTLGLTDVTGKQVRRLFVERTSLLRDPAVGRLDFTHLTFQEYLAAREAVEEGNFGVLRNHAEDDTWREVIVLAMGMARQKEREATLTAFVQKSHRQNLPRTKRKQIALLALACLETSVSLTPALRNAIVQNALMAIPPTDEDEEKLVASAGDPAIPLLAPKEAYTEQQAISCIRTLAMIGSEKAMFQLAAFAIDSRTGVRNALVSVWDAFDRDIFAQHVLLMVEELSLEDVRQLNGIRHLVNLSKLSLTIHRHVGDKAGLEELTSHPHLTELVIYSSNTELDVFTLATITSLRKLTWISPSLVANVALLDRVSKIQQLTHLTLEALFPDSIQPLSALVNLEELSLSISRDNPLELESLQSLKQLRRLSISTYPATLDLHSLKVLPQLQELEISSDIVPESIQAIAALSHLVRLSIPIQSVLIDGSIWTNLPNLTSLTLRIDPHFDFEQLVPIPNLRELKIISQEEVDIASLAKLEHLTHLDISQCKSRTITPIANISQLTELILGHGHGFNLDVFEKQQNLHISDSPFSPDLFHTLTTDKQAQAISRWAWYLADKKRGLG